MKGLVFLGAAVAVILVIVGIVVVGQFFLNKNEGENK